MELCLSGCLTKKAARLKASSVVAVLGDTVNDITGEVLEEQTDFTHPGMIPLAWTRRYGSLDANKSVSSKVSGGPG